MKVKDLQIMLEKLDPQLDLVCLTEDEEFLSHNESLKLFEIDNVSAVEAVKWRNDNGQAMLKFGKSDGSRSIGIINLISVA